MESVARRPIRRRLTLLMAGVAVVAAGSAAYQVRSHWTDSRLAATPAAEEALPSVEAAYPDQDAGDESLVLPGDVLAFYDAPIYARVNGYLQSWTEDIGSHVKTGQLIGVIDTPELDQELMQAHADYAAAQAKKALADVTANRWRALLVSNSVSVQSSDEKASDAKMQQATVEARLADINRLQALSAFKRIVAPFDGVITERNTDVGALINDGPGAAISLFKISDTHQMRVYVRVPQKYVSRLKLGLKASFIQPQFPDRVFSATLAAMSESGTTGSRTVLVEFLAPNPEGKLWPNTYAQVTLQLPGKQNSVRVSAESLVFRDAGTELATVGPDNRVLMKKVTVGRDLGTTMEITAGISSSDRVIVSPLDTLKPGMKVRLVGNTNVASAQAGTTD